MSNDEQPTRSDSDLMASLGLAAFGMTRAKAHELNVCIDCKQPATFITEAGCNEYRISGICEQCFDKLFAGMKERDQL